MPEKWLLFLRRILKRQFNNLYGFKTRLEFNKKVWQKIYNAITQVWYLLKR